jgi:hypothetical protein
MGLASHPSSGTQRVEVPGRVEIIETIEMKESQRITHAPGIVAVLDGFHVAETDSFVGRTIQLCTPTGSSTSVLIEAVRDHGTTISFFFRGLTRTDIPKGSWLEIRD